MNELKVKIPGEHRLEKDFTSAWEKRLKDKGWWCYKITDASRGKKPYDVIIVTDKGTYHVEVKVVDSNIFHVKDIRDNQWRALKLITELKQKGLLVIYSKKYNDYKIIEFERMLKCDINDKIKLIFN